MSDHQKITDAWYAAEKLRPYRADPVLIADLTPAGGNWTVEAEQGAIMRSIMWNGIEAALINPRGDLNDITEGAIAMGMAATPVMDKSLRCIMALADSAGNLDLIRRICCAAIAHVERPAPSIPEPADEEDSEDEEPETLWESKP